MGLENIKKEILNIGKTEANLIIRQAKDEAENIIHIAESEIQEMKTVTAKKLAGSLEEYRKMKLAEAVGDSNNMLLKKRSLLQDIMDKVLEHLKENKEEYIQKMLDNARHEIDIHVIKCDLDDKDMFNGFKLIPTVTKGGFIAENKDGSIIFDCTFNSLLMHVMDTHVQELAAVLFR